MNPENHGIDQSTAVVVAALISAVATIICAFIQSKKRRPTESSGRAPWLPVVAVLTAGIAVTAVLALPGWRFFKVGQRESLPWTGNVAQRTYPAEHDGLVTAWVQGPNESPLPLLGFVTNRNGSEEVAVSKGSLASITFVVRKGETFCVKTDNQTSPSAKGAFWHPLQ